MKNPIPYRVKKENEKFYKTTQFAYFFGLSHLLGFGGFWFLGIPEMAWFNLLVSSPSFILALILNRLGKHNLAFFIAFVELFVHQTLGTYFMGWSAGLQYLLIYLAGLSFFNPQWKRAVQVFMLTLISVAFASLYLFCQQGVYPLPQALIKPFYIGGSVGTIIVLSILISRYSRTAHKAESDLKLANKELDEANKELDEANKQSRSLLLNILPETIADRLTNGETLIADHVENSTILFCDLVGFTKMSSNKNAKTIVDLLNHLFYKFDSVVEKMKLEKIKTIGDGYMIAAGVPEFRNDHALAAVVCAFKMINSLKEFNKEFNTEFNIRIGINSGPVVAGVIGKNKFTYDLWGDSVNIASRMESGGVAGGIHISEATYQLVKDHCIVKPRGTQKIKGKGEMNTFLVTGVK